MKNKLHPGAKWLFRIRAYSVFIFLSFFLIGFILSSNVSGYLSSLLLPILYVITFIIVVGEIYARMAYNRWFYEFTDSNLKIERGIIWKRYSNVPYERVQNVDIHRGIIARMLGFSSVMIQTAGFSYGGGHGMGSEGYLPAISQEEAEKIRTFLMKRISKNSKQGL